MSGEWGGELKVKTRVDGGKFQQAVSAFLDGWARAQPQFGLKQALEYGQVLRALSGDSFQVARGFGKLPVLEFDQAQVETGVRVGGLQRQSLSEVTLSLRLVAELEGIDPEIIQNGNRVGLKRESLEKRTAGFSVVALLRVRYPKPEEGFRVPICLTQSGKG